MKTPLVTVVGAGNVGATAAQRLIEKNIADVILFDIADGLAAGKALDLMQAAPVEMHPKKVKGTDNYADIKGSDVIIVTAGMPRKPGMSRDDLLVNNAKIVSSVCEGIKANAPDAIVIIVSNPLDIMTDLASRLLQFPKNRVFGMAGVLDAARMRYFISQELNVLPHEVDAMVFGGHGDLMVPVMSHVKVKNAPLTGLSTEKVQQIVERTQNGGAEIVKLLKTGSAFYAPASSAVAMVQAILTDSGETLPVCAHCNGQYGLSDMYCGVAAKLGKSGIQEIVEISLSETEKQMLTESAQKVSESVNQLKQLGF